jgi:hypothetical protein
MKLHTVTYDADSTIVSCSCGKSLRLELWPENLREYSANKWAESHQKRWEDKPYRYDYPEYEVNSAGYSGD